MSIDTVRTFLEKFGVQNRIQEFTVSSATVELAAQALSCAPERIAKTLSFKTDDGAIVVVCAGDARIDNRKFKEQFHTKAKMPSAEEVTALIGHAVGGVCPFALKDGVRAYLDVSLRRFDSVYPACGSAASAIELTPDELAQISGGEWIDVCKDWEIAG